MTTAACRSCGAPIIWMVMEGTGRNMPVDREPDPEGTIIVLPRESLARTIHSVPPLLPSGARRYRPHWASCPNADQHRRRR